jgi:hypothetical protein
MTPAEALAATIPMKPPAPRAPGLECRRHLGGMTLHRRWFRPKHYVFSLGVVAACAWLGGEWARVEAASAYLVFGALLCASLAYNVMSLFVNETNVVVTESRIDVTHGPLPSPFGIDRQVERHQVHHLSVVPYGTHFAIACELKSGATMTLVAPLISKEQAEFALYQLKDAWRLAFER